MSISSNATARPSISSRPKPRRRSVLTVSVIESKGAISSAPSLSPASPFDAGMATTGRSNPISTRVPAVSSPSRLATTSAVSRITSWPQLRQ